MDFLWKFCSHETASRGNWVVRLFKKMWKSIKDSPQFYFVSVIFSKISFRASIFIWKRMWAMLGVMMSLLRERIFRPKYSEFFLKTLLKRKHAFSLIFAQYAPGQRFCITLTIDAKHSVTFLGWSRTDCKTLLSPSLNWINQIIKK